MLEGRIPYKHLHSGSLRENKELQWHSQTDGNITISLRVFDFLLIVEQYIVFIHDAAFFMHVRAFA